MWPDLWLRENLRSKLSPVRTYSHALLSHIVARRLEPGSPHKAALGATLPDTPMLLGAAWLWTRRKSFSRKAFDERVCGRSLFRTPDAALHSAFVVASAMLLERVLRGKTSAFTLGWAGHVLADLLTHGKDARPVFWPVSQWRFESPASYREKDRHGKVFALIEHAAVLVALLLEARRTRKS